MTTQAPRSSYESVFRNSKSYEDALKRAQKITRLNDRAKDGSTPLGMAAFYGHQESCAYLLQAGAKIDFRDGDGWTPLALALNSFAQGVNIEHLLATVLYLMSQGANLNAVEKKYGQSILILAIRCNEYARMAGTDLAGILLERGVDPKIRTAFGATALYTAAKCSDFVTVKNLLKLGLDPRAQTEWGGDALNAAFDQVLDRLKPQQDLILDYLLSHGARLDGVSANKTTTLMKASGSGHVAIVKACLHKNMKFVHLQDGNGMTALHYAAAQNRVEVIRILLKFGANAQVRDLHKRLPLDLAQNPETRQIFLARPQR